MASPMRLATALLRLIRSGGKRIGGASSRSTEVPGFGRISIVSTPAPPSKGTSRGLHSTPATGLAQVLPRTMPVRGLAEASLPAERYCSYPCGMGSKFVPEPESKWWNIKILHPLLRKWSNFSDGQREILVHHALSWTSPAVVMGLLTAIVSSDASPQPSDSLEEDLKNLRQVLLDKEEEIIVLRSLLSCQIHDLRDQWLRFFAQHLVRTLSSGYDPADAFAMWQAGHQP